MSQSAKDIRETLSMLERLTGVLEANAAPMWKGRAQARIDAESLRRISMTLHRWHELECGDGNGFVMRDEETQKTYWVNAANPSRRYPYPDKELGARARLISIMKRYPSLTSYVQGDPRGCALYILQASDIPAGVSIDSCYSRGLAVFK